MRYQVLPTLPIDELKRLTAIADRVAVLTDDTVDRLYLSKLQLPWPEIIIPSGENNKSVPTCMDVWTRMSELGLTRHSMLLNVGGGVVTDLGGFCAATYMRGIEYINVSTTLLGGVDASIGGKTGVDLGGWKNRVGVFAKPLMTFLPIDSFDTLSDEQLLSGYGEIVKMAYITSSEMLETVLTHSPLPYASAECLPLVETSLKEKDRITSIDPKEQGERKYLNFGHTAGHAFEEYALSRGESLPHGYAVAHGILVALILSHTKTDLPTRYLYRYAEYLNRFYGRYALRCNDYESLITLMKGDKKNHGESIRFVLISEPGVCKGDIEVSAGEIGSAFDIYRDLTGQ